MTDPAAMTVTLHIGSHFAAPQRLLSGLARNRRPFQRAGILMPDVLPARRTIDETLAGLDGLPPIEEEEDALMARLTGGARPRRLILSNPFWLGNKDATFRGGALLHEMPEQVARIRELVSRHPVEIALGLRNPALIVNDALGEGYPHRTRDLLLQGADPLALTWVAPIERLLDTLPDVTLTLWCEEDTPLIWPRVLRAVAGLGDEAPVLAGFAALGETMHPEGMARLRAFLRSHAPRNSAQAERVLRAFLDKYADARVLDPDLIVPGWTEALLAQVTAHYEADVAHLAAHPRIRALRPH